MKKFLLTVMAVVLLIVWGTCVYRVNDLIPQVSQSIYPGGEWVLWKDGVELNVKGMRFMEDEEIRSAGKIPDEALFPYEMRLLWVETCFRNTQEQEVTMDMLDLGAESAGWSNIPDVDYYQYLGEKEKMLKVRLQPGEEVTYELPYLLLKVNFTESEWRQAEQKEYYITWSLYPEKKSVTLRDFNIDEKK